MRGGGTSRRISRRQLLLRFEGLHALFFDDAVEFQEADERVVAGVCAEEVGRLERLVKHRVDGVREPDGHESLVELLEERRCVRRGVGEALAEVRRGKLRDAVDVSDVGDWHLGGLDG